VNLTNIHGIVMLVYFAFVLGIGFLLKRRVKTSTDFFLAGLQGAHSRERVQLGCRQG